MNYTPESMRQLLLETQAQTDAFCARCEQAVVRTRKATARMMSHYPLGDQVDRDLEYVHGWRALKGKWLPDDANGKEHGLDAEGRLRVFHCSYIEYSPEWIDEFELFRLTRCLLDEAGRVATAWQVQEGGCQREEFEWQGDRVVRSTITHWLFQDGELVDHRDVCVYDYEYAIDGRLEKVCKQTTFEGSAFRPEVVFARPKRGLTLKKALRAVEDFLVEHIPLAVKEQKIESPLYAILLTYCGEDITSGWPQAMSLLTEAHRERVLAEQTGERVFGDLWFTLEEVDGAICIPLCEQQARTELDQRALQALELFAQSPEAEGDELRLVLCRAAMRLNKLDWHPIASVTEDFILTAVDDHGETNPFEDWAASVPAKKLKRLQAKGFMPKPEDYPPDEQSAD